MLRRSFRFGLLLGLLGGAAAAVVKAVQGRLSSPAPATPAAPSAPATPWTPIPDAEPVVVPPRAAPAPAPAPTRPPVPVEALQEPVTRPEPADAPEKAPVEPKTPAKKAAARKKATPAPWVEPVDGGCPASHPVKAKLSSKIFHLPGGFNYARTTPDRCYLDAAAAEADGLRQSKR